MEEEASGQEKNLPMRQKSSEVTSSKEKRYPAKPMIQDTTCRELIRTAFDMLGRAYAPYSGFQVGAALLSKTGKVYTGCNIENAAFTPTNCAERTAFFKGISEGELEYTAIAIVGGRGGRVGDYCTPCGVCLQVMNEFCEKNFAVILAKSPEDYWLYTLSELLPNGFSLT